MLQLCQLWIADNLFLAWAIIIALYSVAVFFVGYGFNILYSVPSFILALFFSYFAISPTLDRSSVINTENLACLIQEGVLTKEEADKYLPKIAKWTYDEMRIKEQIGEMRFKEVERRIAIQKEKKELDKRLKSVSF